MTAQIPEMIRYQGEDVGMCTEPLEDYFAMSGTKPRFMAGLTSLWRGYVGSWEIVDDRLYLIGLKGTLEDRTEASLTKIFPGSMGRVFAYWYSGTIRLPQGKQLEYVHMGYDSTFERDVLLDVEQGIVMVTRVQHNGVAESDGAPEG